MLLLRRLAQLERGTWPSIADRRAPFHQLSCRRLRPQPSQRRERRLVSVNYGHDTRWLCNRPAAGTSWRLQRNPGLHFTHHVSPACSRVPHPVAFECSTTAVVEWDTWQASVSPTAHGVHHAAFGVTIQATCRYRALKMDAGRCSPDLHLQRRSASGNHRGGNEPFFHLHIWGRHICSLYRHLFKRKPSGDGSSDNQQS